MFRKLIGACVGLAMMGVAGTANAVLMIDFEGTGLLEGTSITDQITGLTISGGELVTEGSPQVGFNSMVCGFDTVCAGAPFDGDFLAPLSSDVGHTVTLSFQGLVTDLVFTLGDIDPSTIAEEEVKISAYDGSNLLLLPTTITVKSDDPSTGDGFGTLVDFGTLNISRIEIENIERTAYGVDNISAVLLPEPSMLTLFATGLALLGFLGWRRRGVVRVKAA